LERNVGDLSGGELQRFAIAVVAVQEADIYMFDEPSSYLDVKQRLKAAQVRCAAPRAPPRLSVPGALGWLVRPAAQGARWVDQGVGLRGGCLWVALDANDDEK
jgi:ABC-type iron transport system FetAB ATPase subunit